MYIVEDIVLRVGDKAIFRTLRGIEVVDVDSGKVLWETRPEVAVESLVGGRSSSVTRTAVGGAVQMVRVAGVVLVWCVLVRSMVPQRIIL